MRDRIKVKRLSTGLFDVYLDDTRIIKDCQNTDLNRLVDNYVKNNSDNKTEVILPTTIKGLKEKLDELGISYKSKAKKSELEDLLKKEFG